MFDKGTSPGSAGKAPSQLNAFLDKGSRFEGQLTFDGSVRIDGIFVGEISTKGELQIGESGQVEANIKVGSLVVSGRVDGNIQAAQRVELRSTAVINGDVNCPKLKIDEGAIVEGAVQMKNLKTDAKEAGPIIKAVERGAEDKKVAKARE